MNLTDDLSHFFETTMPVERFKQILAGACRTQSKVIVEGTDSSHIPRKHYLNVTFGDIADRDRGRIAVRLAETTQQPQSARPAQASARARASIGESDLAASVQAHVYTLLVNKLRVDSFFA